MRMFVAVLLACALAAPAASALPLAPGGLSAPAAPLTQAKAKAKAAKGKAKSGKCVPGAICPLVGGGDY